MLHQLSIKNIALIEDMTLEFEKGFNVLSGETGAGKSIIVDSLNLVLGERAARELVRYGTDRAVAEGVFSSCPEAEGILTENGIDCEDGMIIVRREISGDKNVCRINGNAVTLSVLKRVADKLADIHGQHEHQLLLNKDTHLEFLDSFASLSEQKENVRLAYTYYRSCLEKLNGDWGSEEERARKCEMLEFQINEIEQADIKQGEEEELRKRAEILNNADKIRENLIEAGRLAGSNALDDIRTAVKVLDKAAQANEDYSSLASRLDSVFYELEDISSALSDEAENVDSDPYELERIEDRLSLLKKLFRKYGKDEEEVLKFYDDACAELERLHNAENTIAELTNQAERFLKEYNKQAEKLSELRHDAAIEFEDRIKSELAELGMKNAVLEVDFSKNGEPTPDGCDRMEFLFSANTGEEVKPLSKIISGGEMSRFMLAMKSVAADDVALPTMVFDEIDTGISGNGAAVVAKKIAVLSKKHQVIAITHLPQLASMADAHFLVLKKTENGRTHTEVIPMNKKMRLREIARLAGGSETELALKRAEEIVSEAEEFKSKI